MVLITRLFAMQWGDVRMQVTVKLPDKDQHAQPAAPSVATSGHPPWEVAPAGSGPLAQSAETSLPLPPAPLLHGSQPLPSPPPGTPAQSSSGPLPAGVDGQTGAPGTNLHINLDWKSQIPVPVFY